MTSRLHTRAARRRASQRSSLVLASLAGILAGIVLAFASIGVGAYLAVALTS